MSRKPCPRVFAPSAGYGVAYLTVDGVAVVSDIEGRQGHSYT